MFPEALMLHYMDDLDSKMEAMRAQFERDADLDSPWTSYDPALARPLLNTQKFLKSWTPADFWPRAVPAPAAVNRWIFTFLARARSAAHLCYLCS